MALDTKKLAAEIAQFKKAIAESDRQIAQVTKAYKEVMAQDDEMGKAVKGLIADIAAAQMTIKQNVMSMKSMQDAAKKVTGDIEMILRRFHDDSEAYTEMADNVADLDKQLRKDRTNKDLIKKYEIAEKALERQGAAISKIANDAGAIRNSIYAFDEALGNLPAYSLALVADLATNMKELGDVIDKKKAFLRKLEKAKNNW